MLQYDPLAPPDWQDPYPIYRRLRDESPAHYAAKTGTWCISRYADVAAVLRDPGTFSSVSAFDVLIPKEARRIGARDAFEVLRFLYRSRLNPLVLRKGMPPSVITSDPPQHDLLRAIVNRGFTPARVRAWEPRVKQVVAKCMDKLHRGEPFDLVRDLAIPLPVTIIAEMLGVDAARHGDFKRWSDEMIKGSSGSQRTSFAPVLNAMGELIVYMRGVAHARRAVPRDDLISALVDPRHGEILDDGMLGQFVVVLLVAGNETTTNLIGNTVNALLDHPELIDRVRADPALMAGLIDEGLRYDSPLQYVFRRTTRDCEIAGTRIPQGASITLLIGSANRDERQFENPDRFDPSRSAKGQLAFGFGIHHCLGAAIARLEARAAFEALLPELASVQRASGPATFVDSFMVRGLDRLELRPAS
jgi:cytochrome P450